MLSAARVGVASATNTLVMLHGIFGRGRNWQTIARAVVAERPEYACWLVDLPHHGDSPPGAHGDSLVGLAADLADLFRTESVAPDAILGHSYGGKVALAFAARPREMPLQVWVIDSTPEVKTPSGTAWAMLDLVRRLPQRFATREEAIAGLTKGGYPLGVAQWMAANLVRDGGPSTRQEPQGRPEAFVWKLDFEAMERLLRDFFRTDLWAVVESPADHVDLHFLKASESSAMSTAAVQRIAAAAGDRVHLHHRPGGHWIHAESPQVVTELLIEFLPH